MSMQSVPDHRAEKTKHVSEHGRENDEGNRSRWIEGFNQVDRLDHVSPENEIDDRLRPADSNKK
jgi:hypothetical protein